MTMTTRLYTYFNGRLVGIDQFGNRYFRHKKNAPKGMREKRWVLYNGLAEPSKVPAEWHGWLHYTIEKPPTERTITHHKWEKTHQPNLTGTPGAYVPPGHLASGGQRAPATADYEAWKP
ncbi:MAG: NADH:ubiquinone oxidoreductase subunit NDUFA12 [Rickettsiales bacterium]|nr:NADH:ubiquinone oxidoreductase subunit NDUFA12 [Rickettsiales bacterium]